MMMTTTMTRTPATAGWTGCRLQDTSRLAQRVAKQAKWRGSGLMSMLAICRSW